MVTVAVLRPPVKFAFNRTYRVVLATAVPDKLMLDAPAVAKLSVDNSKSEDAVLTTKLFVKLAPETTNDCEADGPTPVQLNPVKVSIEEVIVGVVETTEVAIISVA